MIQQKKFTLVEDVQGIGRAGEIVTMAVTPAETGDADATIDAYLGGWSNRTYCADKIAPPTIVNVEEGKRIDFDLENTFRVEDATVGRNGALRELSHTNARTPFKTQEFGFATFIPWASKNDAIPQIDAERVASELIWGKLALFREVATKTALFTSANWDAGNRVTLTSTQKWNGGANSDPIADMRSIMRATIMPIDFWAMNSDSALALLEHDKTRALLRSMHGDDRQGDALINAAGYAQDVETFRIGALPPIMVCPAKYLNESTGLVEDIWAGDVVGLTVASGRSETEMASYMTFRHRGSSGNGVVRNKWIPMGRGINKGVMLEVGYGETSFFPSNRTGGLIKGAYQ